MKQQAVLFPCMVAGTAAIYLLVLVLNELLFTGSEYIRGANWIYLPAGIRLLCTLLFGGAGALGILLASWLACFFYYFPDDFIRAAAGSAISAGSPYLIYVLARRFFFLQASLSNLTSSRLLICAAACAGANALFHHLWLLHWEQIDNWRKPLVMLVGDTAGILVVLYAMKLVLNLPKSRLNPAGKNRHEP
jgi:peptidoglycan biosynthesis protein MviN/MurJ (putative lipid II flippase)